MDGTSRCHVPANTFACLFSQTQIYLHWHRTIWANRVGTLGWLIEEPELTHNDFSLAWEHIQARRLTALAVLLKAS